jgi:uncharacterized protein
MPESAMEVRRHERLEEFLARGGPFLEADEPRHNLELGVCSQIRSGDGVITGPPYLATVESDGAVTGVALRTPPWALLASLRDPAGAGAVVGDVLAAGHELPGCQSTPEIAGALASAWSVRTGGGAEVDMHFRNHVLDRIPDVPAVPGSMRDATAADRDLLVGWHRAFAEEADPGMPVRAEQVVDARLHAPTGGLVLWERDGDPVSLTGYGSPTPAGIRIGPVYTPPDLRGRGYAQALVATVSRRLLEGGRRFCFLFTDQRNPTANQLYARIGYQPLNEIARYRFSSLA